MVLERAGSKDLLDLFQSLIIGRGRRIPVVEFYFFELVTIFLVILSKAWELGRGRK